MYMTHTHQDFHETFWKKSHFWHETTFITLIFLCFDNVIRCPAYVWSRSCLKLWYILYMPMLFVSFKQIWTNRTSYKMKYSYITVASWKHCTWLWPRHMRAVLIIFVPNWRTVNSATLLLYIIHLQQKYFIWNSGKHFLPLPFCMFLFLFFVFSTSPTTMLYITE